MRRSSLSGPMSQTAAAGSDRAIGGSIPELRWSMPGRFATIPLEYALEANREEGCSVSERTVPITVYDDHKRRCPRLGHEVTFQYCRT